MKRLLADPKIKRAVSLAVLTMIVLVLAVPACDEGGGEGLGAYKLTGGGGEVQLDIRPGGDCPSVQGDTVTITVLGRRDFDACTIEPSTVLAACASPVCSSCKDINDDGYPDMKLQFSVSKFCLVPGGKFSFTAKTYSGKIIEISGILPAELQPNK